MDRRIRIRPNWHRIGWVVLAAYALTLVTGALVAGQTTGGDSAHFLMGVLQIACGGDLPAAGLASYSTRLGYTSAWPLFLFALPLAVWRSVAVLTLTYALLTVLCVLLCHRFFRRVTGPVVALLAAAILAGDTPLIFSLAADWLVLPAACLAVFCLASFEETGRIPALVGSAFFLSLANQVHAQSFVLFGVFLLVRWQSSRPVSSFATAAFVAAWLAPFLLYLAFPFEFAGSPGGLELLWRSNVIVPVLAFIAAMVSSSLVRTRKGVVFFAVVVMAWGTHVAALSAAGVGFDELRMFGYRIPLDFTSRVPSTAENWYGFRYLFRTMGGLLPYLAMAAFGARALWRQAGEHLPAAGGGVPWSRVAWLWFVVAVPAQTLMAAQEERIHLFLTAMPPLALAAAMGLREVALWLFRGNPGPADAAPVRPAVRVARALGRVGAGAFLVVVFLSIVGMDLMVPLQALGARRWIRDDREPMLATRDRIERVREMTGLGVLDLQRRVHGLPAPDVAHCSVENSCFLVFGLAGEQRWPSAAAGPGETHFYYADRPVAGRDSVPVGDEGPWLVAYTPAVRQEAATFSLEPAPEAGEPGPVPAGFILPWRAIHSLDNSAWDPRWRKDLLASSMESLDLGNGGRRLTVSVPRSTPADPRLDGLEVAVASPHYVHSPCSVELSIDGMRRAPVSREGRFEQRLRYRVPGTGSAVTVTVAVSGCSLVGLDVHDVYDVASEAREPEGQ